MRTKTALLAAVGIALLAGLAYYGPGLFGAALREKAATQWHDLEVPIGPGLYDEEDDDSANATLEIRLKPGAYALPQAGRSLVTFVYKKRNAHVVPFEQWHPCTGCDKFVDTTQAGLRLECFKNPAEEEGVRLMEIGCRFPAARLVVVYRCYADLQALCGRGREIRDRALQSFRGEAPPRGNLGFESKHRRGASMRSDVLLPNPRMQLSGAALPALHPVLPAGAKQRTVEFGSADIPPAADASR